MPDFGRLAVSAPASSPGRFVHAACCSGAAVDERPPVSAFWLARTAFAGARRDSPPGGPMISMSGCDGTRDTYAEPAERMHHPEDEDDTGWGRG